MSGEKRGREEVVKEECVHARAHVGPHSCRATVQSHSLPPLLILQ